MRLPFPAPSLLVLLVAAGVPARPAAVSREVPLRFSCPDGARVTWTSDEESSGSGTTSRRKGSGAARVVRDGDTCRLELEPGAPAPRPPQPPPPLSAQATPEPEADGAARDAAPAPPPALVASAGDGAFLRWDGVEAWLADAARPDAAALLAREEEVWRETIARWAGKTAVPTRTHEETLGPAGADVGAAPLRVRWALRKRLPCPGDRRRRCVELWARTTPDEDVLRQACGSPRDGDAAHPPRHVVRELVVVTAPDDLLPRRARLESTSRPACPGAGPPASTERWQRSWSWTR